MPTPVDFIAPIERAGLKGCTALVTGGASGIGAGIVRALAEQGAIVTIADINVEAGTAFEAELHAAGLSYVPALSTPDWASQVAAFEFALTTSNKHSVDIVLACAGIAGPAMHQSPPFTEIADGPPQPPLFQIAMINVNLIGSMYTATLAAHYWRKQERLFHQVDPNPADRVIILVASNIAYYPSPGFTGYSASKMGLRGFWKSLRADPNFHTTFRTNLLAPHIVRTPMTATLQPVLDVQGAKMVEIEDCVECLMRMICDTSIRGRAVQVNPEKDWFDLHDDLEDFDGSKKFAEHFTPSVRVIFDLVNPSTSMS